MSAIEPNVFALLIFTCLSSVSSLGFLVMSGAFPLATRPDLRRPLGQGMIGLNVLLLIFVLYGTMAFGIDRLRWSSMVIMGGMAFLFTPALFNIWPERWRDGMAGLAIVMLVLGLTAWSLWAVV